MIPPLPPPMPPWPGGKTPWERKQEAAAADGQPSQLPPQQVAEQARPQPNLNLRPQIVHGLVPPSMIHPTYPMWITPPPYFRPGPPARPPQPQPQLPQQPQPQQQQQPAPQPQQIGPMRVERTEENPKEPQPFRPVLPVSAPGLPLGARHRVYWNRT